jgi:hypothetical protein
MLISLKIIYLNLMRIYLKSNTNIIRSNNWLNKIKHENHKKKIIDMNCKCNLLQFICQQFLTTLKMME